MALESLQLTPTSEALVIIATEKYIGEGFDYPRLDTLFLAMPIAWKGMIQQCAGRLHRENEGKKDVRIYDYIDMYVPMLNSMYHKRLRGYAAIGYRAMAKESPTLFDDITDIEASSSNEQIFNGSTFLQPFVNSLNEAKCSIIISSPKVYLPHRSILPDLLKELSVKGIEIVILTAEEGDIIHRITTHGLRVKIVMNLSICGAIIDKSIVWYGDINPLGYNTEENNILKMQDSKLANELLNVLLSDTIGLHGN
jgi:hypothetical protein